MSYKEKYSQDLVSYDSSKRLNALSKLKLQLINDQQIDYYEMRKIWKALFYSLWISDKPQLQNELSEKISDLVYVYFNENADQLLNQEGLKNFIRSGLNILNKEWNKIDKWRINKFLYIVRVLHKKSFECLMNLKNKSKICELINLIYFQEVFQESNLNQGIALHIIQIFNENILEIKNKNKEVMFKLFAPFVKSLAYAQDKTYRKLIKENIFDSIVELRQKNKFKILDLKQLEDLIFNQAKLSEINDINRNILYSVVENLNQIQKQESIQSSSSSDVSKKKKQISIVGQNQNGAKKQQNNKTQDIKKINKEKQQGKSKEMIDQEQQFIDESIKINESKKRKEKELEEMEEESFEYSDEEEDEDMFEQENDDPNQMVDFQNIHPKILKKLYPNLPEYYYKSPKERRKYFQDLNKKYSQKLQNEKLVKKPNHNRKVQIMEKKNQVQKFSKVEAITKIKKSNNNLIQKQKTILKKK